MDVLFLLLGAILWNSVAISAVAERNGDTKNQYRCGIRMHEDFPLNLQQKNHLDQPGQWPWYASLYYYGYFHCGGSLIDQQYVLTSASCVTEWYKEDYAAMDPSKVSILLGINKVYEYITHESKQVQYMNVSQIIIHPEYKKGRHDIALLVLSKPIRYSKDVTPICIEGVQRNRDEDLIGQVGSIVGYYFQDKLVTCLLVVKNTTECAQQDPSEFRTFCTDPKTQTHFCTLNGDSGLYFRVGDHWELRGIEIVQLESRFTDRKFTNVAYYYEWIRNETGVNQRASKLKCQQYSKFARTYKEGRCANEHKTQAVDIIDKNERHICTGSIISEKFVLTKIPNLNDSALDWDDLWVDEPRTKIINEIFHPKYDPETLRYDVMLLELTSPLTFTSYFLPICLGSFDTDTDDPGVLIHVETRGRNNTPYIQQYYHIHTGIEVRIVPNEECKSHWKYNIYDEDICVVYLFYDFPSGGCIQTFNEYRCMVTQIGVFKGLIDPKSTYMIGVYSRVSTYLDWIEEIVWGNLTGYFELTVSRDKD